MSNPDPGWYPDPTGEEGLRYWDGSGWTDDRRAPDGPGDVSAPTAPAGAPAAAGPSASSLTATVPTPQSQAASLAGWKSPKGLGNALRVLFIISAVVTGLGFIQWTSFLGAEADSFSSVESAVEDALAAWSAWVFSVFLLTPAIGIVFIIWMFRVTKNNAFLGRPGTTYPAHAAIWIWFVPVADLIVPGLHLQEVWKGADGSVPRGSGEWKQRPASGLVWAWLVGWAAALALNVLYFVRYSSYEEGADPEPPLRMISYGQLAMTVAAVLGVFLVVRLSRRQVQAAEQLGAVSPAAVAAPAASPDGGAWHPDPMGRHELRYWDGTAWTDHVSDGGATGSDPVSG